MHQPATIRSYRLLSAVAAGLLFAVGACAPDVPSPTPATIASAAPTASPVSSFEPADIERWIAFRQAYGLRSDLAWVMQVARDPANANEMKVPLLPGEINAVATQNRAIQDVMPAVIAYGHGFADYGGARIEGTKGIVLFGSEVEAHQATLDRLFGAGRIVVLKAPYSIAELEALGETVMAERNWFSSLGVELIDANPYELANQVRVRYISPDTSPEAAILAHFEHPDWMTLRWLGPPLWTGPRGRLVVRIVDRSGQRLPVEADATCTPTPSESSVRNEALPSGTNGSDRCTFDDVPAVAWTVVIDYIDRQETSQQATVHIVVPPGGTGTGTVVIDQ